MRTMSFNVFCAGDGEQHWKKRRNLVTDTIRACLPDTFGLQEAHIGWMERICKALPEYSYVGVGRNNGKKHGEFSPVFYRADKFQLLDSGTFWLSATPEKVSRGWDGACIRICSFAVLKDKKTGKVFAHFNTHLDHKGKVATLEGAKLIAERTEKFREIPLIITGDFNVTADSEAYKVMIENGFSDARLIAKDSDDMHTFHNFYRANATSGKTIDFIFVRDAKEVTTFRTVTDKPDGLFPSDHYPVVCEITL